LTVIASTMGLSYYQVNRTISYSATYATSTADALIVLLLGLMMFYTGETMHRDRELRVEPLLWSFPIPNPVLLLSKFFATATLSFALMLLVGLTAIALQLLRGNTPVEVSAYLMTYSMILTPSILLAAGLSIALNVLLRDKYLTYVVSLAIGGGLFYLYSQGYNHWLYNPLLYQLWAYADLTGATGKQSLILIHRVYCLGILGLFLSLAIYFYPRRTAKGLIVDGRLNGTGWSLLIAFISVVITALAGLKIVSLTR
jgi:ABC-2 type transport system permease protein